MSEPVWIPKEVVLAIHDEQIAEHGGLAGLRDAGLLDSALARARNLFAHEGSDIVALAAAYGFGIARSHPFNDGNKRTSAVVTELFLVLNGIELKASDAEVVRVWLALAQGSLGESGFLSWLRAHI